MLMGLCSTAVTLALCVLVFFTVFERQAAQDVSIYSDIITAAYYQNGHSLSDMGVGSSDLRVTLIQPDGTVLFDNAVSGNLENHLGRPEVRDALAHGEGHAERHSDTTSQRPAQPFRSVPQRHSGSAGLLSDRLGAGLAAEPAAYAAAGATYCADGKSS